MNYKITCYIISQKLVTMVNNENAKNLTNFPPFNDLQTILTYMKENKISSDEYVVFQAYEEVKE